jgi:glycerophosphoryl diester phosphodiesterase
MKSPTSVSRRSRLAPLLAATALLGLIANVAIAQTVPDPVDPDPVLPMVPDSELYELQPPAPELIQPQVLGASSSAPETSFNDVAYTGTEAVPICSGVPALPQTPDQPTWNDDDWDRYWAAIDIQYATQIDAYFAQFATCVDLPKPDQATSVSDDVYVELTGANDAAQMSNAPPLLAAATVSDIGGSLPWNGPTPPKFTNYAVSHRGLWNVTGNYAPENSVEAVKRAFSGVYGPYDAVEIDVRSSSVTSVAQKVWNRNVRVSVVIHDFYTDRTTSCGAYPDSATRSANTVTGQTRQLATDKVRFVDCKLKYTEFDGDRIDSDGQEKLTDLRTFISRVNPTGNQKIILDIQSPDTLRYAEHLMALDDGMKKYRPNVILKVWANVWAAAYPNNCNPKLQRNVWYIPEFSILTLTDDTSVDDKVDLGKIGKCNAATLLHNIIYQRDGTIGFGFKSKVVGVGFFSSDTAETKKQTFNMFRHVQDHHKGLPIFGVRRLPDVQSKYGCFFYTWNGALAKRPNSYNTKIEETSAWLYTKIAKHAIADVFVDGTRTPRLNFSEVAEARGCEIVLK